MNKERLLMLANYLDKLSKEKWDYTIFASVDENGSLIRGDALGHCSILWPKEFYVKQGQLFSKDGTRNPIHHATQFFDIPLITCLHLFGSSHAVDYFKTDVITSKMVADKIKEFVNGTEEIS